MSVCEDMGGRPREAQKRINRAVEMARAAVTKPELEDIYLRRFHAAMDALESREEGEAVYDALRGGGWYRMAAQALARTA